MRSYTLALALMGALVAFDRSLAARRGEIIPETTARQHGLARPWFTQVQLDQARGRVTHIVLNRGTLLVGTDQAVVHAIDAETGQTLWAEQVGRRGHPSYAPGANKNFVAVINGSFLYIVNRFSGKLLWKTQLEGAPGAAPAMSPQRVYVPMVDGMVYSYLLEPMKSPLEELGVIQKPEELTPEEKEALEEERRETIRLSQEYVPPLSCKSFGRALVQPIVTHQTKDEEYVAWPTDRGFLFFGRVVRREDRFTVRFRLETEAGIAAQPDYAPPDPNLLPDEGVVFAASRDGFVHAVTERGGNSLWRFSTAEPILESPVVIGQSVYVVTQPGGLYCVDAKSGVQKWWTYQVAQFIAASADRVYVADKLDRIVVLSAASGARLDTIPASGLDIKLLNRQTDRIYLAASTGLIQCLHEMELAEPIVHRVPLEPVAEEPAAEEGAEKPAAEEEAAPADNPFRQAPSPAAPGSRVP